MARTKRPAPDGSPIEQPRHVAKQPRYGQWQPDPSPFAGANVRPWSEAQALLGPLTATSYPNANVNYGGYDAYTGSIQTPELGTQAGSMQQPTQYQPQSFPQQQYQPQPPTQYPDLTMQPYQQGDMELARQGRRQLSEEEEEEQFDEGGGLQHLDGQHLDRQHADGLSEGGLSNTNPGAVVPAGSGNDDLAQQDAEAAAAKREAESKRHQLPPFVQKLSSFLQDPLRYPHLICWADDGKSFMVVDEEGFTNQLLPEVFKHRTYPSFVRQLNMYGFHKIVGLSDNSMKASEHQKKPPHRYWSPHFIRNRPDLLWLIQKPQSKKSTSSKRGQKNAQDSETAGAMPSFDRAGSVDPPSTPNGVSNGAPNGQPNGVPNGVQNGVANGVDDGERGPRVTAQDLAEFRRELQTFTEHQAIMANAIQRLRQEHNQVFEQAAALRIAHEQHENSITAILSFLASLYNNRVDGHGVQNLPNLPPNINQPNLTPPGGNSTGVANPTVTPIRRTAARGMIEGVPHQTITSTTTAGGPSVVGHQLTNGVSSPAPSIMSDQNLNVNVDANPNQGQTVQASGGESVAMTENGGSTTGGSPAELDTVPAAGQVDGEGNMGPATPQMTVGSTAALSPYKNTTTNGVDSSNAVTLSQRNQILAMIPRGSTAAVNTNGANNNNTALVPLPPRYPTIDFTRQAQSSEDKIHQLMRLSAEQHARMEHLKHLLTPLSPTGSIQMLPGLSDTGSVSTPHSVSSQNQPQDYLNGVVGSTTNTANGIHGVNNTGGGGGGTPTANAGTHTGSNQIDLELDAIFNMDDYETGNMQDGDGMEEDGGEMNNNDGDGFSPSANTPSFHSQE